MAALFTVGADRANASPVTIKYTGAGGNSYNGYYTYPYFGTADGKPMEFMCDSFNEHIDTGESWHANVLTVAQYGASLAGGLQEANEIAYLYEQAVTNGDPLNNIVAWFVKENAPDITADPSALALYNSVTSMTFQRGEFSDVRFYVPVNVEGAQPQTLAGGVPAPEPGTLLMMGSGLVGLASWVRRRA